MDDKNVKFIRKNGRIIPISGKKSLEKEKIGRGERLITHTMDGGRKISVLTKKTKTTAAERFGDGFKAVAGLAGAIGGAIGGMSAAMEGKTAKHALGLGMAGAAIGAAGNAAFWGTTVGALNAAVGQREKTKVKAMQFSGFKRKKK